MVHVQTCIELCYMLLSTRWLFFFPKHRLDWEGPNEAEENGKITGKTPKSSKMDATIRNSGSAKKELVTKKKSGKVEDHVDNSSLALSEMVCCDNYVGLAGLNKDAAKKGSELMVESKRVVLEDRRRKSSILSC